MKTATLTIRLDGDLNKLLNKAVRQSGRNRSAIARDALRRQLRISQFEALRRKIMPFAEAAIDVDSPNHLDLVKSILRARDEGSSLD